MEPDGLDAYRIQSEDFGGIAFLHDPSAGEMGRADELYANARLIAEAPAMAELLASFVHEFGDKANNSTVGKARAILARMEGK